MSPAHFYRILLLSPTCTSATFGSAKLFINMMPRSSSTLRCWWRQHWWVLLPQCFKFLYNFITPFILGRHVKDQPLPSSSKSSRYFGGVYVSTVVRVFTPSISFAVGRTGKQKTNTGDNSAATIISKFAPLAEQKYSECRCHYSSNLP